MAREKYHLHKEGPRGRAVGKPHRMFRSLEPGREKSGEQQAWVREDKRKGVLLSIMNAPLWHFLERLLEKCK